MNAAMRKYVVTEAEDMSADERSHLEIQVAELRADVRHVQSDTTEIKAELRATTAEIKAKLHATATEIRAELHATTAEIRADRSTKGSRLTNPAGCSRPAARTPKLTCFGQWAAGFPGSGR